MAATQPRGNAKVTPRLVRSDRAKAQAFHENKSLLEQMRDVAYENQDPSLAAARLPLADPSQIVAVNIGGTRFQVARSTLAKCSFFRALLHAASNTVFPVDRDDFGALMVDRSPRVFRLILMLLHGQLVPQIMTAASRDNVRDDVLYYGVDEELVPRGLSPCAGDAEGAAGGAPTEEGLVFDCGPGTSGDRRRLRTGFLVSCLNEDCFVAGRHTVTFRIHAADYIGVGVVDDTFATFDAEFHKRPNSAVYYWTGLLFNNFRSVQRSETRHPFAAGSLVTMVLDFTQRHLQFITDGTLVRTISTGDAKRLKFAVVMKGAADLSVVDSADNVAASIRPLRVVRPCAAAPAAAADDTVLDLSNQSGAEVTFMQFE
jgi:hypothetical protein